MSLAARPGNFGCRFFNYLFGELGINFIYRSIAPRNLEDALRGMRALNIRGSALSMPFKEQAIPLLDEIDEAAKSIGAINTVVNNDGRLKGYNTDYLGVKKCLIDSGIERSSEVTLLGSGGMARAIAYALQDLGFTKTTVVARNAHTRKSLSEKYGFKDAENAATLESALLINATPIAMAPDDPNTMAFERDTIERAQAVMESVADPVETGLVKTARTLDKLVITGFEIITNQAVEQFKLYFGRELDPQLIDRAVQHARS